MATTKPCESEVYLEIEGAFILFPNLLNFDLNAATTSESIPVLGNNCINKAATSSKELTGSAEYCWDCEDPTHLALVCDGVYNFQYWPKGADYVSPNGNPTPLFEGELTLSGGDFGSTASENTINVPLTFSISRVDSSNIYIQ